MAEPILIDAPDVEPLSLADVKLHLRMDADDTTEDSILEMMIQAARRDCEHQTGRKLITQAWDMVLDAFPCDGESIRVHLLLVKAQSIAQITYLDTAGVVQTVDSADYLLDEHTLPGYVFPVAGVSWPGDVADSANAVKVRVVCGYGDAASDVPSNLRMWMLLQVGAMYRNRESFVQGVSVSELPGGFTASLLDGERIYL